MAVLVDDPAETVLSLYVEVFDLAGLKTLRPTSQGCCGGE
jgi:hypothetical protein